MDPDDARDMRLAGRRTPESDLRAQVETLTRQRDALVAAVKEALRYHAICLPASSCELSKELKAAIREAEKE